MSLLGWILLFSLVGGVLSVLAAAVFLLLPAGWRNRVLPHFVSFATGALLGAAFLALLPHALESRGINDSHLVMAVVLFGLLAFFILEKLVLWRHCHSSYCEAHAPDHSDHSPPTAGVLIIIGDAIHNLVDGVLIAAAFLTDIELGIVTSLAVAAHEVPQEVGDFAILLQSGFSRLRAFVFNILSSLTTLVGALAAYLGLSQMQGLVPFILALAAASFIYIAVADLIPGLHRRTQMRAGLQQVFLILAGVLVIYVTHATLH